MKEVDIISYGKDPSYVVVYIKYKRYKYVASEYAIRKFRNRLYIAHSKGGEGYETLNWFRKKFKPSEYSLSPKRN